MTLYVYQRSLDGVLEQPIISTEKEYVQSLMQADLNKMPTDLCTTIDEDGTIRYVETDEHDFSKYWEIETPSTVDPFSTRNEIRDIISVWNILSDEWKEILPSYIEEQFTITQHITFTYKAVWDKTQSFTNHLSIQAGDHTAPPEFEDDMYYNPENGIECRKAVCKEHGEINDLPFSDYNHGNTMFAHVIIDHCDDLQNEYPKLDPSSLIAAHKEIIRLLNEEK